jgi:hypothetical protein
MRREQKERVIYEHHFSVAVVVLSEQQRAAYLPVQGVETRGLH